MAVLEIPPRTTGTLSITLQSSGSAVTTAAVTGDVYSPTGRRIAASVLLNNAGGGVYQLLIDPLWSTDAQNRAIQGQFWVDILAVTSGYQRLFRQRFLVRFPTS